MVSKILEEVYKEDLFPPGSFMCPGCGASIAGRYAVNALGKNTVVLCTAGCGAFLPMRARLPSVMTLLENPAAPATGIKAGLDFKGIEMNVLCFMGDGGTTDLGLGGVTAAAERGDPIIYVCYDNEAYMNTGIQRSGSTPFGAWTTTTPAGKQRQRKDVPRILADSGAAYVATASVAYLPDYVKKIKKAEDVTKNDEGMAYIHIQSPCPTGWRFPSSDTIKIGRLAVQTGMWSLYEIYKGELRFTVKPKERMPVGEYLKPQGRFRRMTDKQIEVLQKHADERYEELERVAAKA